MANIIDSLLIAVKMDNTGLDKGLKQAESKVSSFADRIKAGALAKFSALASVGRSRGSRRDTAGPVRLTQG